MDNTIIRKEILCLANSRKYGGRCVVGKEVLPDKTLAWVRPVGGSPKGEVMPDEMCFEDESLPQLLDVIDVPLVGPQPLAYQPENWLVAPEPWTRTRVADMANIDKWVDPPAPLWENGFESLRGTNDRFPYDADRTLADSARFIKVPSLDVTISDEKREGGDVNRQLRGAFVYASELYDLRITDMEFEEKYQDNRPGIFRLGPCYLTITVGEPFQAKMDEPPFNYKLIAAILMADQ